MNSLIKIGVTCAVILPLFISFHLINSYNFYFQVEAKTYIVEHPETLPRAEYAEFIFPGFSNITADIYWLQAVQYIGRNAISSEYRKYLYEMMHLITELNPYFESPYVIGQLLLPSWNDSQREDFSQSEKENHIKKWELLWLKWVSNFCNKEKMQEIFLEKDLKKIIENSEYRNPCRSFEIPYYLAYIYFYYLKDYTEASQYYKVVSAQEDAPQWARILAAIMQGRWGERETSLYMFLSLAQTVQSKNEACIVLSSEIENIYSYLRYEDIPITWELIAQIEILRDEILPPFNEESENIILADTECSNYLTKAIRELALLYLEEADTRYIIDFPDEVSAMTPERLFELWYINYIPRDYQQYEDYGIRYLYSEESGRFDYEMNY